MNKLDAGSASSHEGAGDMAPADDPFPKHKPGLKPYRAPYYVVGLMVLISVFPALRHRASSLVGTKAGQIEVAGDERTTAPVTTAALPSNAGKAKSEASSAALQTPAEAPALAQSAAPAQPPSDTIGPKFVVGDRLKLTFYERIESEEDKWVAAKSKDQRRQTTLQMRIEYSGEYQVLQDGAVSVPMLGNFDAAGRTNQQLQTALAKAFEAAIERPGNVTVAIIERPPVYIVGPFRAPGAFKHVPGMTVLHVVSLAGGLNQAEQMNWQLVDSAREMDKHSTTVERTKRLLARHAVLVAERDGKSPVIPTKLRELGSEQEARSLIETEGNVRKLAVTSFASKQKALTAAIELANSDIGSLSQRLEPIDSSLKMRSERVRNFDRLNDKGLSNSNLRLQAQSELLELESRRQDVVAAIAQAKQKLAIAQQDIESNLLTHKSELEKEITTLEFDLPLALRALKASEGILSVMKGRTGMPGATEAGLTFEILKQTPNGPKFVKADLTTPVELGDVIHVK